MRSQNPLKIHGSVIFLACFAARFGTALTYEKQAVKQALAKAELVAEVEIEQVESQKDPTFGVTFSARAKLLTVLRGERSLSPHTTSVTVSGIGGEVGELGVYFTGYPRPHRGQRYRAYLNRQGEAYTVVGFDNGLVPLTTQRTYTRNRTDGSNGDGTGPFLFWDTTYFPIPYYFSAPTFRNSPDLMLAIDKSIDTWRKVEGTSYEFLPMGCTESRSSANDGVNQIILVNRGWDLDPMAIAVTRNYYVSGASSRTGMILDSDILINAQNYNFSTDNRANTHDMQNIITHETGHILGLGHEISPEDSDATMYAYASPNEFNKVNLHANDLEGIRAAYGGPSNRFPGDLRSYACALGKPPSCLAVHGSSRPTAWGWATPILFLLGLIGGGRRFTSASSSRREPS